MAEERIVDDEYGRGVKFRKTKEGLVDVTDELVTEPQPTEEGEEEFSFAYPMVETDEDDEDLVGLSPEEAAALRQKKLEAAKQRRAEYEQTLAEGNAFLEQGSFHSAELKFEKALQLDELATEASVGYWRAKTNDFTNPDALIEEYVEPGIESLEYDLGYEAVEIIKKEYRAAFQKRYDELQAEEEPLYEQVIGKQQKRRELLRERRKKRVITFAASAAPMLLCIVLAVVFGLKNFSTPDDTYIPVTIIFGVAAFILFFVFAAFTNKLINACRIYATNEKLSSTEEGEELFRIQEYKNLYGELLKTYDEQAERFADEEE